MPRTVGPGVILGILAFAPALAAAELITIYDAGQTRSAAPFLAVFDVDTPEPTNQPAVPTTDVRGGGVNNRALQLPIRTPELTPGPVRARPLPLPSGVALPRPLFLIGADAFSRDWLARHRARLAGIQAVGMLVAAETKEDVAAVIAIADGLPILPASASDIVAALDIVHVPVLISERGIEQ